MTQTKAACPICGKASVVKLSPFCSQRCATLDLGRWLGEAYRVPAVEENEEGPADDEGA